MGILSLDTTIFSEDVLDKINDIGSSISSSSSEETPSLCPCTPADNIDTIETNILDTSTDADTYTTSSSSSVNKVKINNVRFNKCQSNSSTTKHCISDIYT